MSIVPQSVSSRPLPSRDEIIRNLEAIVEPGKVYEVRIPQPRVGDRFRRTWPYFGYFDDPKALSQAAYSITGHDAVGVFYIPNPVKSDLLARADNKLIPAQQGQLTTDDLVLRRRFLLVDVDSKRLPHISATEEEVQAAIELRDIIESFLLDMEWPQPRVRAMSGNGGHLIYHLDLPNDSKSRALCEAVLKTLANIFSNDQAEVDVTTFNAARLVKINGTVAAKGEHVPRIGRIWRLAHGEYNFDSQPVPRQLLEQLTQFVKE